MGMEHVLDKRLTMKPIRYIDSIDTIKNCRAYLTSELFFKDLRLNCNDYTIESAEDVEVVISIIEALSIISKCYHVEWHMTIEDESNLDAVPKGIARKFLMSYLSKQDKLLIKGCCYNTIDICSIAHNKRVAYISSHLYR